jgi:hypothetical protein
MSIGWRERRVLRRMAVDLAGCEGQLAARLCPTRWWESSGFLRAAMVLAPYGATAVFRAASPAPSEFADAPAGSFGAAGTQIRSK